MRLAVLLKSRIIAKKSILPYFIDQIIDRPGWNKSVKNDTARSDSVHYKQHFKDHSELEE